MKIPDPVKSGLRTALHSAGLEIVRSPMPLWLNQLGIETVLDVGSNTGQFACTIRKILPSARVYSFEPIPECAADLRKRFARDRNFTCFQVAVGAEEGRARFFKNSFSPSSSLLEMANLHVNNFPYTRDQQAIGVDVRTLDSICSSLDAPPEVLIKLDVQGYEDRVVVGGQAVFSHAKVVISEVSFETLYMSQPLFSGIYDMFRELGFEYHGNWGQLTSPIDGRVLQADAIFVRP
jgi:FkbM family methyltransferase